MEKFTANEESLVRALLLTFLDRQGAREPFVSNLRNFGDNRLYRYLDQVKPDNYITSAFKWSDVPEGRCYWSDVNAMWLQVLDCFNFLSR